MLIALEALRRRDGRVAVLAGDRIIGHMSEQEVAACPREEQVTISIVAVESIPTPAPAALPATTSPAPAPADVAAERRPVKKRAARGHRRHLVDEPRLDRQRRPVKKAAAAPPARETTADAPRESRQLSSRPIEDDGIDVDSRFRVPARVPTEGLDMEAIDAVVRDAKQHGRAASGRVHSPERVLAKELWDGGERSVAAIAKAVGCSVQSVYYWRENDDWEGKRAARLNGVGAHA